MKKEEFVQRLTIQLLQSVRPDSIGSDDYAIRAAKNAIYAADKIQKQYSGFFEIPGEIMDFPEGKPK